MAITRRSFLKGVAGSSAATLIGPSYWRLRRQALQKQTALGKYLVHTGARFAPECGAAKFKRSNR